MARTHVSVLELCLARAIKRHGMVKGARVAGRTAAFVAEWAKYQNETGDDPGTVLAFHRWAQVPESTAFLRLAEFRELFPEHAHETPAPLAQYVIVNPVKRVRRSTVHA